jgi:hypothetical protein
VIVQGEFQRLIGAGSTEAPLIDTTALLPKFSEAGLSTLTEATPSADI